MRVRPSWASDGDAVYFTSNRSGRNEIWKQRPGDEATQVTRNGGIQAAESPDGRFLYYIKKHHGRSSACQAAAATKSRWPRWYGTTGSRCWMMRLYYIATDEDTGAGPYRIVRYDVQDGRTRVVKALPKDHNPAGGLTVSPAAGAIVYSNLRFESEIMLGEGFK